MSKMSEWKIKKANKLRDKGWTYKEIADFLKVTPPTIYYWLNLRYREKQKECYQENKEYYKEYMKEYYENNKEEKLRKSKEWYEENKELKLEKSKEYYQENKEQHNEYMREYYQNNKEYYKAKAYARKKGLGFIPLNEWFPGSVAHHINHDAVVYIPESIHKVFYPRNVFTGEGMKEINYLAIMCLEHPEVL